MRDFGEYLRAYRAYVLANLGWGKALSVALVWLAGMFAPLVAKTLFELPNWVAMTWMIVWALLGYIFAPYGQPHHIGALWSLAECPLCLECRASRGG